MLSTKRRLTFKGRSVFSAWAEFQDAEAQVAKVKEGLLKNPGVRPLDRRETARIRDYARATFGSVGYAPWLEAYTVFRGAFHEGWIPENFLQKVAIQKINGLHKAVDASRSLMTRLVATPLLPDLAHFVGGEWREVCGAPLERGRVPEVIFANGDEVCVKTEASRKGRGTSFVTRAGFDLDALERTGNFVVQSLIRQHPFFDALSPRAVATLRVTTGKLPGAAPFLVGTFLRCGLGKARAVGDTSLRIAVSNADGALADFASDPDWRRMTAHPETGTVFAGLRIPSFGDLVARCVELHDRLPQIGLIGWDVILDSAGEVRLMEVNTGYPGMKLIEMSQGPSLRAFRLEQYAAKAGTGSS
jgi:hypothetical protein